MVARKAAPAAAVWCITFYPVPLCVAYIELCNGAVGHVRPAAQHTGEEKTNCVRTIKVRVRSEGGDC